MKTGRRVTDRQRSECGKPLTDPVSRKLGIGPKCWLRKHGPSDRAPHAAIPAPKHTTDPDQIPLPLEAPVSEPRTYRKKPVEIQAMQWREDNLEELLAWVDDGKFDVIDPEDRIDDPELTAQVFVDANGVWVPICTGEWLIRDLKGFYPCQPDVFAETYEPVADSVSAKDDGHPAATTVQEGQN